MTMNASDHAPEGQSDVLRSAWKRHTELDLQSLKLSKQSTQLRKWIAILGVVATFLAIVTNEYSDNVQPWSAQIMRIALISVPIIISVLAAYTNKFFGGANWLVMRAGAEEIKKEIYLYRTVLRNHSERDRWLSRRLTTIQRRTYKSMGGELIIDPYEGKLPMYFNPDDPNSDPGFNDLTGDEYMRYRVIDQRDWHRRRIVKLKRERIRIQMIILVMGGIGAFLAAIPLEWTPGWGLAGWVAFTAAIASAFTGWEQLRGLDKTITIYSRVILELTIIRDEWEAISPHQRTETDFVNMVREAENVMWAQNMQYISTMQEAVTAGQGDEAELVENMLKEGDAMTAELQAKLLEEAKGVLSEASEELGKVVKDSADMVKGMVSTVTGTASDLQQKVQDTVESEVEAFEDMADSSLERVTTEAAAVRTTVTQAIDIAMDEAAATRDQVETTTQAAAAGAAAFREAAKSTVDTALAEAATTRSAVQATTEAVAAQAGAIRDTVQDTVTEQATATQEVLEATMQDIEDEVVALRETVEYATDALSNEAAVGRETIETNVEVVVSESEKLRKNGMDTVLDEVDEIREVMDERIASKLKELNKGGETKISEKLDAMLDEAAEVIDHVSDEMRDKMAEEVAEEIVHIATGRKKNKRKGSG